MKRNKCLQLVLITVMANAYLFGAGMQGNTPQKRFEQALQSQTMNAIVPAFADLTFAAQSAPENYTRFAHFIRNHRPIEEAILTRIADMFFEGDPVRQWTHHGQPAALDAQLNRLSARVAARAHLHEQQSTPLLAPHADASMASACFHRQRELPRKPLVNAAQSQRSLQEKCCDILAHICLKDKTAGERILKTILAAGGRDTYAMLNQYAKAVYFALSKDAQWTCDKQQVDFEDPLDCDEDDNPIRPDAKIITRYFSQRNNTEFSDWEYSMLFYPGTLLPHFDNLTLQDYETYEKTPCVKDNDPKLVLSGGFLSSIAGLHAMSGMETLETLDLSNNQLTTLPAALSLLTRLDTLDVSGNKLQAVPRVLSKLIALKDLNVSNNHLHDVSKLFELAQLESLSISGNALTEVPATITKLTKLTTLNLNNNQFTEISTNGLITGLPQLHALSLGGNRFTTLPLAVENFPNLELLFLFNNRFDTYPEKINDLPALRILNLNDNNLAVIPESITRLQHLESFHVKRNRLTTLPATALARCPRLTEVNVIGNPITDEESANIQEAIEDAGNYECCIDYCEAEYEE